jgi:hypothetical protein
MFGLLAVSRDADLDLLRLRLLALRHLVTLPIPICYVRLVSGGLVSSIPLAKHKTNMIKIPTEPIGSIPRPVHLIAAITEAGDYASPTLD